MSVDGVEPGIYHYDIQMHQLRLIMSGDFRDKYVQMCIGQSRPHSSSCAFILTADWQRFMYRYRHPRAYRTLLINTAELAHKYVLLATAFKLGTFLTPAFRDEIAEGLLGVDGLVEAPLYTVAVG